jgi:HD-GYP domain-containing protein (c-di-GMP phosphodiesterase class II)
MRLLRELADDLGFGIDALRTRSEHQRAMEVIRRQVNRLNALRQIDMAITASLDPRVTFNVLLDQVTNQLGVDAADILLFDSFNHVLTFAAGRGFLTDALRHTRLRLGEGHAGHAAATRRVVVVQDMQAEQDGLGRAPLLRHEGFVSYVAAPLLAKGQIKGVLELFHRSPLRPEDDWFEFLEALAGQAAIALDNASLFEELQRSNLELVQAYDRTLEGWSGMVDLRDKETEGHTQRVTELTIRLAAQVGIPSADLVHVRRGALLHDIGKIGIPDGILHKPGPLTDEEWAIMRLHPTYAYELLSPIAYLRPALDIPYCHHEKWDGSGYPRGLKGEQIPLAARVFAVVDVWDALRSDRPYRPGWPEDKVLEYLRQQEGSHFDAAVAETFLGNVEAWRHAILEGNPSGAD